MTKEQRDELNGKLAAIIAQPGVHQVLVLAEVLKAVVDELDQGEPKKKNADVR